MPPNWPRARGVADLVADLARAAAERIALDRVVEARDRQDDQAKLAAGGIGLRHLVALEQDVVRRVQARTRRANRYRPSIPGPCCR